MAVIDKDNFINNMIQSVYYYTKDNIGSTILGHTLNVLPDSFDNYDDLENYMPCVIVMYTASSESKGWELGGRKEVLSLFDIYVYAGGDKNEKRNELMKHKLSSKLQNLFDCKEISYKEFPGQTHKFNMTSTVKIDNVLPVTTRKVDRHRSQATVYVSAIFK